MLAFQTAFFLDCVFSVIVAFFISILITGCIDMIYRAYNRYDSKAIELWNKIIGFIFFGGDIIFIRDFHNYFKFIY